MDNSSLSIINLMRKVAAHRDAQLRKSGPEISANRLRGLQAALARRFPVETALHSAAIRRDVLLQFRETEIPLPVKAELTKRLAFTGGNAASNVSRLLPCPTYCPHRRLASAAALAAAVIGLIGGAFYFSGADGRTRTTHVSRVSESPVGRKDITELPAAPSPADSGDRLFVSSRDHLTLRVSRAELASFQPPLLAINGAMLTDRRQADQGLPLDLPVREMLMNTASPTAQ